MFKSKKDADKPKKKKKVSRRQILRAQDVLDYEALMDSGICVLDDQHFSITLRLSDVNYVIAPPHQQESIIEQYAKFLNSFDSAHHLQVSVVNRVMDQETVEEAAFMPYRPDSHNALRREFNRVIHDRLATGRNNTVTDKYFTITVEAEDYADGRARLMRVATESISHLRSVGGCTADVVTGQARARVIHSFTRPGERFDFDYAQLVDPGKSSKDFLAPAVFDFSNARHVRIENEEVSYLRVLWLEELPAWLSDRLVKELTDLNMNLGVSLHISPIDQGEGLDLVKRRLADMSIQRANETRKLTKQGLPYDLMPHELEASYEAGVDLRHELETSNQKLFTTTLLVGVAASSIEELDSRCERVIQVGNRQSCRFSTARYMQEAAFNAFLPLGRCRLPLFRTLTTGTTAVMIPFTSQELFEEDGVCYGVNALSKNLILASRSTLMNGNAFFLGTSGSGKSMYGKSEIHQVLLNRPEDEVIIIDPDREYAPVGHELGATTVEIHAGSQHCVNPMDIVRDSTEGDLVRLKSEFVLSMCELLIGGTTGLSPSQRSIIDRCVTAIYNTFFSKRRAPMPTLATLTDMIRRQDDAEAPQLATSLELYSTGSFSGFSQQTNVDTSNRFVIYDISQLGQSLRSFGMLIILEQIWNRVIQNRAKGIRTWLYIDEFHLLFSNDYAAAYFQSIFKRARKYGLNPTGLTQNIEELLMSERARLMLANCDMLALLNQTPTDAESLQELFQFSDEQRGYYSHVPAGQGLLKMGQVVIPFDNSIPVDTRMYKVFSTKPGEMIDALQYRQPMSR